MSRRRPSLNRALTTIGALLVAAGLVAGVSACSSTTTPSAPSPTVALPTGTQGGAHFDDGFLQAGSGPKTVDLYFDPLCPYCNEFEKANGATLAAKVANDSITLRLHPLTFLDRSSNGTAYSSRASAALTCVAQTTPDATLDYLALLYKNQPEEGSDGLSDKKLISLATGLNVPDIGDCLATGANQAWAQANTQRALTGPIEGADIPAIKGTPTVIVNGTTFTGSITDNAAFSKFLASK